VLSPADFDRAVAGKWRPAQPWLLERGIQALAASKEPGGAPALPSDEAQRWRQLMIDDIAGMIRGKRAVVVYLPARPALLDPGRDEHYKTETRAFAKAIGATFHDSSELYAGMTQAEIRANFLPYDGHWNLKGSDRLGAYLLVGALR
jgi:hypothetical protein